MAKVNPPIKSNNYKLQILLYVYYFVSFNMSPISSTNISLPIGLYPWLKYGDDSNTTTLPFLTAGKLFQILFASN